MVAALSRYFPRAIYNLDNLGFADRSAKVGAGLIISGIGFACLMPEQDKIKIAAQCVKGFRAIGIDPKNLSDEELKKGLWNGVQSIFNLTVSSPLFYSAYHFIHTSEVPLLHRIGQSFFRGLSGTLVSMPALTAMYAGVTVLLPLTKNTFQKLEYGEAENLSRAAVFLVALPILEFNVDKKGCGIPSSAPVPVAVRAIGVSCIAARLAWGVMFSYDTIDKTNKGDVLQNFATRLFGTTFAQWGVNASLQTIKNGHGTKGIVNYLAAGDTYGKGNSFAAAKQLGRTLALRTAFTLAWTGLDSREVKTPSWAK